MSESFVRRVAWKATGTDNVTPSHDLRDLLVLCAIFYWTQTARLKCEGASHTEIGAQEMDHDRTSDYI